MRVNKYAKCLLAFAGFSIFSSMFLENFIIGEWRYTETSEVHLNHERALHKEMLLDSYGTLHWEGWEAYPSWSGDKMPQVNQ